MTTPDTQDALYKAHVAELAHRDTANALALFALAAYPRGKAPVRVLRPRLADIDRKAAANSAAYHARLDTREAFAWLVVGLVAILGTLAVVHIYG